ncbi:Lipopolysaccharide export system protein LptC [Sinobacterium norvegicum]|uniref:Lipopolysaccharide export system protein LptC n=1 Tax=Sinobacterium norvegicum TaxID=1641715 RepID=A0ABM9AKP0_9GAMM|nr:LPS export ABC transporter periplasmic protein LptC [Sinobacterium norvegicum]CAH0993335.1 Lipopolysaccharide export system protein LptC [Sinobacterium norvegicum]
MSKRSRQVQQWLAAAATVIGVTAVAYFTSPDNNTGDLLVAAVIKAPAWYITEADHRSFDVDGKLDTHSIADKAIHFDHSDTSFVTNPVIKSYEASVTKQIASAKNATVNPDKTVLLTNNVVITTGNTAADSTVLNTEILLINTVLNTADTKEAVTITQASGVTKATGMHADFNKEFISLLSGVHSVYEP